MWHRTAVDGHRLLIDPSRNLVAIDGRAIPMHLHSSRITFLDPVTGLVVKIARGNADQCLREARLWKHVAGTPDSAHFASVLVCHARGTWIVQRLVVHNGYRTARRRQEYVQIMGRHNLFDDHDGNWVVRDRRVVIVDYGC